MLIQAWGAPGVQEFYNLVVSLSTMTAVIPYAFCALALSLIAAQGAREGGRVPRVGLIEVVGFLFSLFTIYGCGPTAVLYGLLLLVLGIPVFVWQRRRVLRSIPKE